MKVTVNGQPITDMQIAQRLALFKLEGSSGRQGDRGTDQRERCSCRKPSASASRSPRSRSTTPCSTWPATSRCRLSNLRQILAQNGVNDGHAARPPEGQPRLEPGRVRTVGLRACQVSDADVDAAGGSQADRSQQLRLHPQGSAVHRRQPEQAHRRSQQIPFGLQGLRQRRAVVAQLHRRRRARHGAPPCDAVPRCAGQAS